MSFLNFLGSKKDMKDTDTDNRIETPIDSVEPVESKKSKEYFRVGRTTDGGTTLTLMSGYNSMTLTMTPEYCERLIKMLRATYMEDNDEIQ